MNPTISPALEQLIEQIGPPHSPTYQNLHAAISLSPMLIEQLNRAVENTSLQHFAHLSEGLNASAAYDSRTQTIELNLEDLDDAKKWGEIAYVLGHETRHALNDPDLVKAHQAFLGALQLLASSSAKVHDYHDILAQRMAADRQNEATAELAGYNIFVDHLKYREEPITLKEIYRSSGNQAIYFIKEEGSYSSRTYTLRPGYNLEADFSIQPTPENQETVARYYYDRKPDKTNLGPNKNSDYRNFYGVHLISDICRSELRRGNKAKIMIDLEKLGLDESLLEQNGLDLGGPGKKCFYYTPQDPETKRWFEHTIDSHTHQPRPYEIPQQPEIPPKEQEPAAPQVQSAVERLNQTLSERFRPEFERWQAEKWLAPIMAETTYACVAQGISAEQIRQTGINLDKNLLVVDTDQPSRFVTVDAVAASKTDPAARMREAHELLQEELAQQTQQQTQQQEQQQQDYLQQQHAQLRRKIEEPEG